MGSEVNIVMGSRLNNRMEEGAMPWTHRWIGNPIITRLINWLFGLDIADAYCGLRVIRRDDLLRMDLRGTGMEFALEYLTEAGRLKMSIAQVSITYRRRLGGQPKLRTLRDGYRSIAFMVRRRFGVSQVAAPSLAHQAQLID
jgi:hypothetical protein